MAVRRLYEPLCIAFGTTVSSPTVPTYQLYDLPHKFTPRLYMESEDPNLVLREIGVWAGWEQAGSANTRSFLACDGGLDRRALEVTYPASTGAAKSRTQATARERTQAGVLGSAYPSQVRAARGRSPASREGADQQPSFGGVSGSAGAGGKRASGVLFQAQPLHGRSSLGSRAPAVAAGHN